MTPAPELAITRPEAERMGFFTDTTVCIGCKACEVACKQWNDLPSDGGILRKGGSYDHTGELSATTWRHVRFVERLAPSAEERALAQEALAAGDGGQVPSLPATGRGRPESLEESGGDLVGLAARRSENGHPSGSSDPPAVRGAGGGASADVDRWVFMSDVCKHCGNAGCLDACPTGALIRTEFGTVFLQSDVCNGCGYCIPSCPFGVVDRDTIDGRAAKCTLCYDRLEDGLEPACAKSCPTDSIQFGPYEELVERAAGRVVELHRRGIEGAYLYGAGDESDETIAGGLGAFFLLTEPPERFGLPAHAESPIQQNVVAATLSSVGAGVLAGLGVAAAFLVGNGRR